jgi:ASC-1-like (ASCH) protein
MLLFVRQKYVDQIRSGEKTCEIRAGKRYRNIRPGSILSLNGRERVTVTHVESATADQCAQRNLIDSAMELQAMYPAESTFYVFHFVR